MAFYAGFAAFTVILVAQAGANAIDNCTDLDANTARSLAAFDEFKSSLDVNFTETIKGHRDNFQKRWEPAIQKVMDTIKNHSKTLNENCIQIAYDLPGILDAFQKGINNCVDEAIDDYKRGIITVSGNLYKSFVKELLMKDCIHGTSSFKNNDEAIRQTLKDMFQTKETMAMWCIMDIRDLVYLNPVMTRIINAGEQCEYTVFPGRRLADWKEPKESTTLEPAHEESSQ